MVAVVAASDRERSAVSAASRKRAAHRLIAAGGSAAAHSIYPASTDAIQMTHIKARAALHYANRSMRPKVTAANRGERRDELPLKATEAPQSYGNRIARSTEHQDDSHYLGTLMAKADGDFESIWPKRDPPPPVIPGFAD